MRKPNPTLAIVMVAGAGLGAVVGSITGNTGVWVGIGVGIGVIIGLALSNHRVAGEGKE